MGLVTKLNLLVHMAIFLELQNNQNWSFVSHFGYKDVILVVLEVTKSHHIPAKTGFGKFGKCLVQNYEKSRSTLPKIGFWVSETRNLFLRLIGDF